MAQSTMLKYLTPEQQYDVTSETLNTTAVQLPELPQRPNFDFIKTPVQPAAAHSFAQTNNIPVTDKIKATTMYSPSSQPVNQYPYQQFNQQQQAAPVFQRTVSQPQMSVKQTSQPEAENKPTKKFILLKIYKSIFAYFTTKLFARKVKPQIIDELDDTQLRQYADKLIIRNQEINAYLQELQHWAEVFAPKQASWMNNQQNANTNSNNKFNRMLNNQKPVSINNTAQTTFRTTRFPRSKPEFVSLNQAQVKPQKLVK